MIIWKGWGVVVPVLSFVSLLLTQALVNGFYSNERFYTENFWPKLAAFILAGALIFIASAVLKKKYGSLKGHTFFFVPILYWAGIVPVLGGLATLV